MYIFSVALNLVKCVSMNMELCSGAEMKWVMILEQSYGRLSLRNGTERLL